MDKNLKYRNEDDKCYGATGMAIAMVVLDGKDKLLSVDLDGEADSLMSLNYEFYFSGNQTISAKTAWNHILNNFNLSMAMSIANVMCRSMVMGHSTPSADAKRTLRDRIIEEGRSSCQLDDDESMRLFDKNYNYLSRIFTHRGVQQVARDFATVLKERRQLTRGEVIEHLRALNSI